MADQRTLRRASHGIASAAGRSLSMRVDPRIKKTGPVILEPVRVCPGLRAISVDVGMPVHPEWYSNEFGRLLKRAGLRRITLHDSRHTTLTLMEHAGVPISIVSKWAGHYDSAFTQETYVRATDQDLARGSTALAKIHKIA